MANSATDRSSLDRVVLSSYIHPRQPYFRRNRQDLQPTKEVSPGKTELSASDNIRDTSCGKDCRRARPFGPRRTDLHVVFEDSCHMGAPFLPIFRQQLAHGDFVLGGQDGYDGARMRIGDRQRLLKYVADLFKLDRKLPPSFTPLSLTMTKFGLRTSTQASCRAPAGDSGIRMATEY